MYTYSRTEAFVYHLLRTHCINNPHQLSIDSVANSMNLTVEYWEDSSESVCWRGKYKIFLEKKDSKNEQWQEFAHELCHVLWHAGRQEYLTEPFRELQEWQAEYFSYHLCVPSFMLLHMDLPANKKEAIWEIHETFKVELDFAEKRLDKWLQQHEGMLFHQKIAREMSK